MFFTFFVYNVFMKKMRLKTRKIINRSGSAKCDVCKQERFLQRHHIRGRKIPNAEHPSNIANVCPTCHTEIHYGKIIIEGWFQSTNGMTMIWHYDGEKSNTDMDAKPHQFLKNKKN